MKRYPMPNRYDTVRQHAKIAGKTLYVDIGVDKDGVPRSVFLDIAKTGEELRALLEFAAMMSSLALQGGTNLDTVIRAMKGTKFKPQGPVTGDEKVHFASSPLDYVGKHLEAYYT